MRFLRARWWVAALALVALAPGVRVWHHFQHPPLLHAGDQLVPIVLSSFSGGRHTLAAEGRPQIINIFATWCTPCRMEMPGFAAAAERLRAQGIDVVGIDQEESGQQVAAFAREFGLAYPVYIDTTGVTHSVLGARLVPTTIYVGGDGRIRWIHAGPMTEQDLTTLAETTKEAG